MASSTPEMLQSLRKTAGDRLAQMLLGIGDQDLETMDYKVDELIRQINGQPPRPADRAPYASLYPGYSLREARQKAGRLIQQKMATVLEETVQPIDQWLDSTLRVAMDKGDRNPDAPPYRDLLEAESGKEAPEKTVAPRYVDPSDVSLTKDQLAEIAPYADPEQIDRLYPHILKTLKEFEITTPLRQAHFLSQLCHESGSFVYLEELASGEDYEGREDLGNTEPGDGVRFKGRGLIQITGRTNYRDCGEALGVDLIANPERLTEPDLACRCAGWFWDTRDLNPVADLDDVDTITLRINGGYNGYDERVEFLHLAKGVLGIG